MATELITTKLICEIYNQHQAIVEPTDKNFNFGHFVKELRDTLGMRGTYGSSSDCYIEGEVAVIGVQTSQGGGTIHALYMIWMEGGLCYIDVHAENFSSRGHMFPESVKRTKQGILVKCNYESWEGEKSEKEVLTTKKIVEHEGSTKIIKI